MSFSCINMTHKTGNNPYNCYAHEFLFEGTYVTVDASVSSETYTDMTVMIGLDAETYFKYVVSRFDYPENKGEWELSIKFDFNGVITPQFTSKD